MDRARAARSCGDRKVNPMFKYEKGQEVWYVDEAYKASTDKVTGRKFVEDEDGHSITYHFKHSRAKPEHELFEGAHDLVASFLSEAPTVKYSVETVAGETLDNHAKLHDLCGSFIDDNAITSKRTIMERVGLTEKAIKLVEKICDLIGYYEGERDE